MAEGSSIASALELLSASNLAIPLWLASASYSSGSACMDLCLRARSREDVDRCAALLKEMNATVVRGPMEGPWAPGYYYVLFEDPDGIRLEVNFVPGAGLLAEGAQFNPATGYV
jgi:hypothetical protein